MHDHPSDVAYVEQCLRAFIDAMQEADGLVRTGCTDAPLVEVLRFASDLLDSNAEELRGVVATDVRLPDLSAPRDKLDEARALIHPQVFTDDCWVRR